MARTSFWLRSSALVIGVTLTATVASAQEACESGTGVQSLQCGSGAEASGNDSVAIGESWATANASTALGHIAVASGQNSTATGAWSYADELNATAYGYNTAAEGSNSTALGGDAVASQNGATAVGYGAYATAEGALAVGEFALATGVTSIAVGHAWSTAVGSTAVGNIAVASGDYSTATGAWSFADQNSSSAYGYNTAAEGINSTALGANAISTATGSTAVGYNAVATASGALAVGQDAVADGTNSVAIGTSASNGTYSNSVALGAGSTNSADNEVSIGDRTLTGVAPGTLSATSTDAVNGSQLYATNAALAASLTAQSAQASRGLQDADTAFNQRIQAVEALALDFAGDLKQLDEKLAGSTAIAIAMGGGTIFPDSRLTVSANLATYDGAFAGALEVGALVAPKAAINAGIAGNLNKRGKVGARVGMSFGL